MDPHRFVLCIPLSLTIAKTSRLRQSLPSSFGFPIDYQWNCRGFVFDLQDKRIERSDAAELNRHSAENFGFDDLENSGIHEVTDEMGSLGEDEPPGQRNVARFWHRDGPVKVFGTVFAQ
jgi:hypothetical protein